MILANLAVSNADAPAPGGAPQPWTFERIRNLGVVTDVATAGSIFGLSRSSAYELAQRDILPVPTIRIGTRYRVSVAAILAALGATVEHLQPPPTTVPEPIAEQVLPDAPSRQARRRRARPARNKRRR
ncbi:hypothetical protein GCM10027615_15400 [Plantactinospora veratri]